MASTEIQAIKELVVKIAKEQGVDPSLSLAICQTESAFNPGAVRFEPQWIYLKDVLKFAKLNNITADTETQLQKMSWGLGQVMGSVARELGHPGYIHELAASPATGLLFHCRKIAALMKRIDCPTQDDVISAYNAGSPIKIADGTYRNQRYVDLVKKAMQG